MSDQPTDSTPWSWDLPASSQPTAKRALAPENDFRRTVLFTIAGTVLPGLGLIAARRRVLGGVILGIFAVLVISVGLYAAVDRQGFLAYALNSIWLRRIAVALVVIGIAWVAVVVGSHLSLRRQATSSQRVLGGVLVGVLAFAVAAPLALASNAAQVSAGALGTVFKASGESKSATKPTDVPTARATQAEEKVDPWAKKKRLNLLLLGGDADKGRAGTRTDTVILASIDTKTGDTTLFSLPRNTGHMPFPSDSKLADRYPYGFTDGDGNNAEFFLNAMYRNVPNTVPKDLLGETDDLGADAMKLSVGEALGLKVDYYMLINLQGFSKMINALGGIRLNVNTYIPIGGCTDCNRRPTEYIKPGKNRKMTGRNALWFARGRYGSDDFQRMDRQRCVINAIIEQANPTTMLSRYEDIAKAGKTIVFTDMPQEVLPAMVDLSLRVKDGNVRSIVFKHGVDGFLSPNPNFSLMRKRVKAAISEAKKDPEKSKKSTPTPSRTRARPARMWTPAAPTTRKPPPQRSGRTASPCASPEPGPAQKGRPP